MAEKPNYIVKPENVTKSKIVENIKSVQMQILGDPVLGLELAKTLQRLALKATREKMGSLAWKGYMLKFASNPDQLKRLMGDDENFSGEYEKDILCYIVGNSTCGADTTATGTGRNLDSHMLRALDKGVKDDVEEIPLTPEEKAEIEILGTPPIYF